MRPGLLRAEGAPRRHGHQLGRGVALVPELPAILRPDVPRGEGPRARRGLRLRVQRLDGRGVVRRQRRPPRPADARSRCGTPTWPPPRSGATRRAACGRCASARSLRTSGCRASTPATGTRSSWRARRRQTVVCMHIGSSSKMPATSADAPVAVAATLSFGNAMASLVGLPLLRGARALPGAEARVLRGPDRLDPVHPRARRRRVARAPGVGRGEGHRPRAAVELLLPPGVRLLLPRPARARVAGSGSASTTRRSRPTTRTRTRRGRTPRSSAAKMMADLPQDVVDKICRGNAIRMLGLDL